MITLFCEPENFSAYNLCVFPPLYTAETWTMRAAGSRKLLAFEMRCYRRILKVCWKDRVTNKSVRDNSRMSALFWILSPK